SVLDVAPSDVTLEIERYRDVAVLGHVTSPGLLPFRHGLTVRSAIAAAGGIAHADPAQGGSDASATAMRMAEISRLARTRAETLAKIWRLEGALGEDAPTPTAADLGLDQQDADGLLALHGELLAVGKQKQREALELLDSLD